MLFPYRSIGHKSELMHGIIDYLFNEVWSKAPGGTYSLDLYDSHPLLENILRELDRLDMAQELDSSGAAHWFLHSLNNVFVRFSELQASDVIQYQDIYLHNNDLSGACTQSPSCNPMRYEDLPSQHPDLNNALKDFFTGIYTKGFWGLAIIKDEVGTLADYYNCFVTQNNADVCPFCGLSALDSTFDPTRDEFDHFLPKSKYPFNSVNLKNLVPACKKCNQDHKKAKDPLHDSNGNRRKTFYPFATNLPSINVSVSINGNWLTEQSAANISIDLGPQSHQAEIDVWDYLYNIRQRYAATCSKNNMGGKAWLTKVTDECKNYGLTPQEMYTAEITTATSNPIAEMNFLRKPFLEACEQLGLFQWSIQ